MRLLLLLVSLLVVSCAPPATEESPAGFVIVGASVLDGGGGAARFVNVHVEGDTITAVGETAPAEGVELIDVTGLTLAPGFIDTDSHGDSDLSLHRGALAAVSQGITTIVGGQDGGSPFPLAEFFAGLEAEPAAVNLAAYAGHGRLRREVMGDDFRRVATEEEVEAMRLILSEEMKAGALGLGSGLEYDPGIYSETSEVVTLAREAAAWGGRYISHIRSEDRLLLGRRGRDHHHWARGESSRPDLPSQDRHGERVGTSVSLDRHARKGTGFRRQHHRGHLSVSLLAIHLDGNVPRAQLRRPGRGAVCGDRSLDAGRHAHPDLQAGAEL